MNIYVGNLSWSMTDDDLMNLFTEHGTVTSAKILKDKMNGRSKGFGFVEMEDDEAAKEKWRLRRRWKPWRWWWLRRRWKPWRWRRRLQQRRLLIFNDTTLFKNPFFTERIFLFTD